MKTPIELWQELKQMVLDAEKDASKSTRGMKAGGVRLRNAMQDIRNLAMDVRKSVLEHRRGKKDDGSEADEPIVELDESAIVEDYSDEPAAGASENEHIEAELAEPVHAKKPEANDTRNIPFWYSSFSY